MPEKIKGPSHRKTESSEELLQDFVYSATNNKLARRIQSTDCLERGEALAGNGEYVLSINDHEVTARLTDTTIEWVEPSRWCDCFPSTSHSVKYSEIISLSKFSEQRQKLSFSTCSRGKVHQLELFTFKRHSRRPSLWKPWRISIESPDEDHLAAFYSAVSSAITSPTYIDDRPKHLIVILNPLASGVAGRSRRCYTQHVAPVLQAAGIKHQVIETQRQAHASEIVCELTLHIAKAVVQSSHPDSANNNTVGSDKTSSLIDGFVAVGGDGIFHEILNGLLTARAQTTDMKALEVLSKIRLAHIPCGSTDAMAASLHGIRDASTAALHIALGDRLSLDVLRVDAENSFTINDNTTRSGRTETRFACCIATCGFMPDVVKLSEQYRWLGPIRYDVAGAWMLLANRRYRARVSYIQGAAAASSTASESGEGSNKPCTVNCQVCRSASFGLQRLPSDATYTLPSHEAIHRHADDEWKVVEEDYMSVMLIVQPCLSDKTPMGMARHGHLSDGKLKLVLVKECAAWRYLQFLLTMSSSGLIPGQMEHVKVIDAVAVKVEGSSSLTWNLDGELIDANSLTAEMHQGLVDVFARGMEV